jgi:hypothetical protein
MNILSIPSMSLLFDYTPTKSSIKFDHVEMMIADSVWPSLMKSLAEDLKLRLNTNGKSLYRDQKRVATIVTNLDPNQGANPFA